MRDFTNLLERLILTPSRNEKLRLMADYAKEAKYPDRGWAFAAITGGLEIAGVKPAILKALVAERVDAELFALSYDYVGDLAETIALIWPTDPDAEEMAGAHPSLSEVIEALQATTRAEAPKLMTAFLDRMDENERWALLKLVTGGLRIGVSARLAKQALANFGGVEVDEIEAIWHGLAPPYEPLFLWLSGAAEKPVNLARAPFRPVMLAHPLSEKERGELDFSAFLAEWKWDGIRVQATGDQGVRRLYTRTGDDISASFPDVVESLEFEGTIDGELLIMREGEEEHGKVAPFSDLQQRLGRKAVSKKTLAEQPAFIRAYDLLYDGAEDLRAEPFHLRRKRLETFMEKWGGARLDLSPLVPIKNEEELEAARLSPPHSAIEGLMLKRADSPYVVGRPKGLWFKAKRDPFLIDAVLMYAQRGHGKRSSYYSDYTFGVWREGIEGEELVPVGKAYSGFTDEELKKLDKFVRQNTTNRFGPVREVAYGPDKGIVLEVAFEGLNVSTRHKSGVAMRFPRINRLRWDKPPSEADRLEALEALLPSHQAEG